MSNFLTKYMQKIPDEKGKCPDVVTNAMALNVIREMASDSYQAAIPELPMNARINHSSIPYAEYSVHQNEFFNILVNKIGVTIVKALLFENPLGVFRDENFTYGETLEEIFVNLAPSEVFNAKDNTSPFAYADTDIRVFYHDLTNERKYKRTFEKAWTMKAFKSDTSFDSFIDKMFMSLLSSDELDEYEILKELFAKMLTPVTLPGGGTAITPATEITTTAVDWLLNFNKALVSRVTLMSTPSKTRFENAAKVPNATPADQLYLITDADLSADLDVTLYANAFNLDKSTPLLKKIVIDEFPIYTGSGPYTNAKPRAAVVSKRSIILMDKLLQMENLYNPNTLSYNYWLHHHQLISYSMFENAHIFYEMTTP